MLLVFLCSGGIVLCSALFDADTQPLPFKSQKLGRRTASALLVMSVFYILGSTYFVLLLIFLLEGLLWEAGCWVHLRAHTFSPGKIILPKKA